MNLSQSPSDNKNISETKNITQVEIIEGLKTCSNLSEFRNNSELFPSFQKYLKTQEERVNKKEITDLDLNIHVAEIYEKAEFHLKPELKEFVIDAYYEAANQALQEEKEELSEQLFDKMNKLI